MGAKRVSATNGPPAKKLDAIRDIILGPHLHELERRVDHLTQQVKQLQAGLEARGQRQTRRAARHRYLTSMKVNKLAQAVEAILQYLRAEHRSRASSARQLGLLSQQLREVEFKSSKAPAVRTSSRTGSHARKSRS